MSEHESELAKASAENGNFDPQKAKNVAADAARQFQAELKKDDRILRITLLICVAGIAYAIENFLFAYSAKAMIGFGILLLFVSEITVVIKLWYWIVNTRITLQKELRQLRVAVLKSPGIAMPGDMELSSPRDWRGISFWEHKAWVLATVIVALAVAGYVMHQTLLTKTVSEYVTLMPNGASSTTTQLWVFGGDSFDFSTGNLKSKQTFRWLDERRRELPLRVSTDERQRRYTACPIELPEPDAWLQWQRYTQIEENPAAAVKQGDRWTYENDGQFGGWKTRCYATVELPRGATLISREPEPVQLWSDGETIHMVFQATCKSMEHFHYKIQYELADHAASDKPAE